MRGNTRRSVRKMCSGARKGVMGKEEGSDERGGGVVGHEMCQSECTA